LQPLDPAQPPAAMADDAGLVHLGYVGRPLTSDEQLDISLSRVGGAPVWPQEPPAGDPVHSADFFACQACRGPLVMLGQFSAGYGAVPRRLLHLFVCASASCGSDSRAWRALRSVGRAEAPGPAAQPSSEPSAGACSGPAASCSRDPAPEGGGAASGGDDWGAGTGGDDWGVSQGDDWGAAPVPAVDAEIEQLLQARGSRAAAPRGKPASKAADTGRASGQPAAEDAAEEAWLGTRGASPAEAWPCFALEIYDEPPAEAKSGEHEQELLQRYLQSEFADEERCNAEGGGGGAVPPELAEELNAECLRMKAELGEEDLDEGEEDMDVDEEEGLGAGHAMEWLLKFQRRLKRSPEQVVRYSWGGSPLWMAPPAPEVLRGAWPPRCGRCGAARTFELQVMPTLATQLCTATDACAALQDASWGTVCVFTCSEDCRADGPCEEFVVVQSAA